MSTNMPNRGSPSEGGSKLLMPLVLLLVAAVAVWYFFLKPKADVPATHPPNPSVKGTAGLSGDPTELKNNLSGTVDKITETLNGVRDAATADAALPTLQGFSGQIDNMKALFDKVPEAGRTAITTAVKDSVAKMKEVADKVLAMPGVGEKLKPVLDGIMSKLSAFGT